MSISWYLCIILAAFVALLGYTGHKDRQALVATKLELAAALAINTENAKALARLERHIETTDRILAAWNRDRTTLAAVRNAARQAIKEAMRDENFKAWAVAPVPDAAWWMLRQSDDGSQDTASEASGGASGGLPGNAGSGQREQ